MVAESNQHYQSEVLRRLLDDGLSTSESQQIEKHLCDCDDCRSQLDQIAGDHTWWDETASVLSESTTGQSIATTTDSALQNSAPQNSALHQSALHQSAPSDSASPARLRSSLDLSVDWLQPLLQPSELGRLGRVDRYPIDELVGQGGMGVVLRGVDLELNRPVAIKVLSPHLAGVGAARARFLREAQAAASIVHPSIVPIYSVITETRLPYIVMPYIRGGNLQQRIDQSGPLELSELLRIGMQVAEGLVAAHRGGVIHRDIKPSNLLIEEGNGRVLISDFGLARALDDATLTNSGIISGTPQYMSPEQARGDSIDARSDLFSLGSLIYALATGRPPFRAETPLGVLRKVTETAPRPITQINERMPPWLDRLVGQLMQVDVDRRTATAHVAAQLLGQAHAHVTNPTAHPLPRSLESSRLSWKTWAACRPAVLGLGLLALTMLVIPHVMPDSGDARQTTPIDNQSAEAAAPAATAAPTTTRNVMAPIPPASRRSVFSTPDSNTHWNDASFDREMNAIDRDLEALSTQLNRD